MPDFTTISVEEVEKLLEDMKRPRCDWRNEDALMAAAPTIARQYLEVVKEHKLTLDYSANLREQVEDDKYRLAELRAEVERLKGELKK